ncbi:hypothetical protein COCNU_09G005190 [Cocos nucifera]|uniref:Uncharacterized protein n=1 Tax=Cocos nucifera TaxID=13894 RepID=A0A8K0IKB2_COCNU|nr:hypothetical protein COCNU_09G005190 [Cocos nucifera]
MVGSLWRIGREEDRLRPVVLLSKNPTDGHRRDPCGGPPLSLKTHRRLFGDCEVLPIGIHGKSRSSSSAKRRPPLLENHAPCHLHRESKSRNRRSTGYISKKSRPAWWCGGSSRWLLKGEDRRKGRTPAARHGWLGHGSEVRPSLLNGDCGVRVKTRPSATMTGGRGHWPSSSLIYLCK